MNGIKLSLARQKILLESNKVGSPQETIINHTTINSFKLPNFLIKGLILEADDALPSSNTIDTLQNLLDLTSA